MSEVPGRTLKEVAYERMKRSIVNGEWEGGTFLSEKWLSELLQMSKTPIRSALDRLEMMGLVKLSPNQGIVVQEVSLKKIMEIYQLRLSLETYAVNQLTGKLDALFLARLDENLKLQYQAVENDDIIGYVELDRQFHETIISALDNEEYLDAMSRIQDKFLMAVRTTFIRNKKRLWGSMEEHRLIRDALAGNDSALTVDLIVKHIEFVKKIMI
ncbi:GntR family transcriptional regulator [Paenibacillus baekrokdamisoli]|uniref:GntR family transcriptional regulator n=1 Tax=Paenibacillus baekrokdamisoli TaxID=1712516 RepID=A0A3G9IXI5_9BACL|nr:GntR family transcriptional regulator [Paenibacillus baekrokdamisoli]MBB3067912.1 DNA-binding GntR family transcriptional regulator [Paenibacillus baekrokdamisoli]BBH23042.1 GntR family transcriptional regulator [Paenibacillus baekrokdamisoli]